MHLTLSTAVPSLRSIASTAYDTAWVAAVPDPLDRRNPRFPTALDWITAHQHPDGSWGSQAPYIHDRIICTLAALIPLTRFRRHEIDHMQIRRGEQYLWQHAHLLRCEPCELVGFELLLPTLMQLATEAGVRVPPHLDTYAAERAQKLALLPNHLLYSPYLTVVHSLEFLGSEVDPRQLLRVRSPNGSIGNSPAATAFLLHHVDDEAAVAYLLQCLAGDTGCGAPVLEPCETFELLWTAYHRFMGGERATLLSNMAQQDLIAALAHGGVTLSPSFLVPDGDDTAVALMLLYELGRDVDPTPLCQFERGDYFVSFPYERHPSTSVNIHVLQALTRYGTYPQREAAVVKILRFLDHTQQLGGYWIDKWHISPYYATSHAVMALTELPPTYRQASNAMVHAAVDWIIQTQNENGSWGFYGTATTEETAYAVLALRSIPDACTKVAMAIDAGVAYLEAHQNAARPALWIDKCLYYPPRIVDAAINAALARANVREKAKSELLAPVYL